MRSQDTNWVQDLSSYLFFSSHFVYLLVKSDRYFQNLGDGAIVEIEPELPIKHDATPNLKLVMNPEGKMHDWSDLPEEEVPEITQMAMVGNPEIAKTLATNLNDCKGRGKVLDAIGTKIGTNTPKIPQMSHSGFQWKKIYIGRQ